jgi:hypothetical protein
MSQLLPKAFLEETSQKRVRNIEDQEEGEEDVIEAKDHLINRNPKSEYLNPKQIQNSGRLLKNARLLRFPHPSSLRRTSKYASLLRISGAFHPGIFEQPGGKLFFQQPSNVQFTKKSDCSEFFHFGHLISFRD